MKKTLLTTLTASLGFAAISNAALIHRYSFDTDATDSIGSLDGTATAGTTFAGGQLVMDGADEWVDLSGATLNIASFSEVTIEYWGTVTPNNAGFFSAFGFGAEGGGTGSSYLLLQPNRAADTAYRAEITNVGFTNSAGFNGTPVTDTSEHHFAVTVDGTTLTTYLDGNLVGSVAIGSHTLAGLGLTHARIGHGVFTGDPDYVGSINEFRIYDNVLSGAEVGSSFALGADTVPEPSSTALLGLGGLALILRRRK